MFVIDPIDNIWSRISSDNEEHFRALYNYFRIEDPGLKWTPKVRSGLLDGKVDMVKLNGKFLWGLKSKLINWCKNRGHEVVDNVPNVFTPIEEEVWNKFVLACLLPFEPYDYQTYGAKLLLENQRHIGLAATSAGKSLMIYLMIRWLIKENKKTFIIVPDVGLVEQMYSDLKEYWEAKELEYVEMEDANESLKWLSILKKTREMHNFEDFESTVCKIYAGKEKYSEHILKITTWQSVYLLAQEGYFDDTDALIFDECLHPDTLIITNIGYIPIKDIKVNDLVMTYNEETKSYEYKPVVKIHNNISKHEQMFELEMENGNIIKITGNHKVLLQSGVWKRVDELEEGDDIIDWKYL